MTNDIIISTNSGYSIISKLVAYSPTIEHETHEKSVIIFFLRDDTTKIEKPFDVIAVEGPVDFIKFSWIEPGKVEWFKTWISGLTQSSTLGNRPAREERVMQFDFNQSEKSSIVFEIPAETLTKGYKYSILNYHLFYSFELNKLFVWKS